MSEMRIPRPEPSADFRARLRADLMREARMLAGRRPSFADRIRALWAAPVVRPALAMATLVAFLLTGTGVAAAGSLPGDPTYPLKRALEEVELALATTPETKVEVLAAQTQRRLGDLEKAAARSDKAPTASSEYEAAAARLAEAVTVLRSAPKGEKREAVERVVEAAREKHVEVLEQLRDRVPENAQKGIDRAIEQQRKIAPREAEEKDERKGDERPARPSEPSRGGRPSAVPKSR